MLALYGSNGRWTNLATVSSGRGHKPRQNFPQAFRNASAFAFRQSVIQPRLSILMDQKLVEFSNRFITRMISRSDVTYIRDGLSVGQHAVKAVQPIWEEART